MLYHRCLLLLVYEVPAQLVVEVADLVGLVESKEAGEAGHYGPELAAKSRTYSKIWFSVAGLGCEVVRVPGFVDRHRVDG